MMKKNPYLFLALREVVALFLLLLVAAIAAGSEGPIRFISQLSHFIAGDDSLVAVVRTSGVCLLVALVILLQLKKPAVLSVAALLATCVIGGLFIFYTTAMSISFTDAPLTFMATWFALVSSLLVTWRFRGSFPVLGKFT